MSQMVWLVSGKVRGRSAKWCGWLVVQREVDEPNGVAG